MKSNSIDHVQMQGKILVITKSSSGRPLVKFCCASCALTPQLHSSHKMPRLNLLQSSLRPLALTGPLRSTGLHLLCRETAEVCA